VTTPDESGSGVDPDAESDASADEGPDVEGLDRRTLIRLLVGLGIGLPIAIEAATFLGLLSQEFGGGGEGESGTEAGTTTPTRRAVGVGDELLPETQPVERVTDMTLRSTDGGWRFAMTVEVRNDLDTAYEFRLGSVATGGGRTVAGGASTGTMAAGETATITGRWDLPEGEAPERVGVSAVVAVVGAETPREVSARVPLERVAVRG
jgi:hypothetical protein